MSTVPDDRRFARSHEWARMEQDGNVRIGISDYAQERLGDIVFVELPEPGREVAPGEECCVVESVKAASDVFSPIRGTVVAVNEVLTDEPGQLNLDAYGTWIFCVKPDNAAEMDKLLDAASYQALIEAGE